MRSPILVFAISLVLPGLAHGQNVSELYKNSNIDNAQANRKDGTLVYATVQNAGRADQVGGNYAALQFSKDASSAFYGCYKNRKTDKREGGDIVREGDDLCELQANGWDGFTYNTSGTLNFTVDRPPSRGALPTAFAIWLGSAAGSGVSGNRLALLIDSQSNAYFRNGHIGVGPAFGYNPPALYDEKLAPPFPLTISTQESGTAFAVFKQGSVKGGARINAGEERSSKEPIYGFWGDAGTGIGNPDDGVIDIYSAHREVVRIAKGGMQVAGGVDAETVRLRMSVFSALPACDTAHAGTMAYITDAPLPITTWRQVVRTGGGHHRALLACNGDEWHAIDG